MKKHLHARPKGTRRETGFLPFLWCILLFAALLFVTSPAYGTPPYGDPNQPYDRLPGTLETYHIKWAKPLSGGKLKVLFIIPYYNSREVVELSQRLDLEYTVIMNAGKAVWSEGYYEGANATPLHGPEASYILDKLSRERLDLAKKYDAIVIGKVSWEVIPKEIRELILKHIERGTGLVYVTPNRLKKGLGSRMEVAGENPRFTSLFRKNEEPELSDAITKALPFDIIPLKILGKREEFKKLSPLPKVKDQYPLQLPLHISVSHYGKGRIIALDYFDSAGVGRGYCSLSPALAYDKVIYDYGFALLARCVLYSAGREAKVKVELSFDAPATSLKAPVDEDLKKLCWDIKTPAVIIARDDLKASKAIIKTISLDETLARLKLDCAIRDAEGNTLKKDILKIAFAPGKANLKEIRIPILPRGNYTLDARVLDEKEKVLEFASKSFRVEDPQRIVKIETDKEAYKKGEKIRGRVTFSRPLSGNQKAEAWTVDTWNRVVYRTPITLNAGRTSGSFSIPVELPLSRLWDIYCAVSDAKGRVDVARIWVGLPNWNFDDYIWAFIFTAHPDYDWKGRLYTRVIRPYGINASNVYLIYGRTDQYELNERFHLQSISYAAHLGQEGAARALGVSPDEEFSEACMDEFGRMARHIADTGKFLDPKEFPYKWGPWGLGADWINDQIKNYLESAKFGTPYYFLCGEEYLSGEFNGQENSCFSPLTTKKFQEWCRKQYNNDIKALNAEWNTNFTSWDEVRGILIKEAVEKNQLPRWVDFRYFMRSRVWSQFFIDWTDMIRRFIPEARTGYNGHDHYDFSRFRNHMTSGKMYVGQEVNSEWRTCVAEELHQSFSGDRSFLLAAQSVIRWHSDLETSLERKRLPWKMLFAGYRGFDWERGLTAETLGGESSFTPDYSEPLPFFKEISDEVLYLQRGIGKLAINSKSLRSPVAILWAPYNHYISRLHPFQENGFTGTWLYNIAVDGGAIGDCLVLMKSLRMRPTFVAPEDLAQGVLKKRGFRALLLPYNKGMSEAEAEAIRNFVKDGGLVIADNTPGIYSEHGRELEKPRLADLFPITERQNIVHFGKGVAAYLPNGFNHYLARFEQGNYAGSDSVGLLLKKYARVETPVELIDAEGKPRRDTLMPVYVKGSARYVGMLRQSLSEGKEPEETLVKLKEKRYVWDVRAKKYYGFVDRFKINLDMYPKFFALLPANPTGMKLEVNPGTVKQGERLKLRGEISLEGGRASEIAKMGQVVHIEIFGPGDKELEWYRNNLLFDGSTFEVSLPISFSEKPGEYRVLVEYPVTGMKTDARFTVEAE